MMRPNSPNRGPYDDLIMQALSQFSDDYEGTGWMQWMTEQPKPQPPPLTPNDVKDYEQLPQEVPVPVDQELDTYVEPVSMRMSPQAPDNPEPVPGTYDHLKMLELLMEPTEKVRPRVKLERDMEEWNYPHTRKYNYVDPDMTPEETTKEYLNDLMRQSEPRKPEGAVKRRYGNDRRVHKISDDGDDAMYPPLSEMDLLTDEEKFDVNSQLMGQTHKGNKTRHRGKQKRRRDAGV